MPPHQFHISRTPLASSLDPTAGIEFTPPLDSDDLFFALNDAYPTGISHGDRLRSALIEFLLSEQEYERGQLTAVSPSHQNPVIGTHCPSAEARTSSFDAGVLVPEDLRGEEHKSLHAVFHSASGLDRTRRWRRAMTVDERKEYRKRRARGACGGCKVKKRKCTHDFGVVGGEGEGGYEGDSEVGGSPAGGIGLELEKRAATIDEQILSPAKTLGDEIPSRTSTSTVSATSCSIAPWPSPFDDLGYDLTGASGLDESMGLWPTLFDISSTTMMAGSSTTPANPTMGLQEQLYTVQMERSMSVPLTFRIDEIALLSLDRNDFEDETYQSSEEAEMLGKVVY
jgi:hypothetical protein